MASCHPDDAPVLAAVWRLTPAAAARWLACECQATDNPTNPLNTRYYGRAAQTGQVGGFATYASPAAAFRDGLYMVRDLAPAYGYGELVASLGTGDTYRQCRAIELSSWAAGHYGATATRAGCVSRGLAPGPTPAPTHPAVVTVATHLFNESTGRWAYTIRIGTRLTVRGAGYVKDGVLCYPVETVAPNPAMPAGWTGSGYFVPTIHVRLG